MNVQPFAVTQERAREALNQYKSNRRVYDRRDWEIERIYRAIALGKTVISAYDAIRRGGLDDYGRPRLAIMRADQETCVCERYHDKRMVIRNTFNSKAAEWYFDIPWPGKPPALYSGNSDVARLPRIPPQHRPASGLQKYHLLWEADWTEIPSDPYLLKRIGKDAWVVLAAWDLTEVELSVLRVHS
jgi:hypothetical protein